MSHHFIPRPENLTELPVRDKVRVHSTSSDDNRLNRKRYCKTMICIEERISPEFTLMFIDVAGDDRSKVSGSLINIEIALNAPEGGRCRTRPESRVGLSIGVAPFKAFFRGSAPRSFTDTV